MVVRITKTHVADQTHLKVDGLLQTDDIETLYRECMDACGTVTLDLAQLRSADACGVDAIHQLVSQGAQLQGLSPYLELLLSTSRSTIVRWDYG
jgi:hypothetical protein